MSRTIYRFFLSFTISDMISGYIEFHRDDTELKKTISGDQIVEICKSHYPSHRVARFKNVLDEILDMLTPYWGQFEWVLDDTSPV
jgi:hypothetical protein